MPQQVTVERTKFVFIPGQSISQDYLSMRKRGWRMVHRDVVARPNEPKLISLTMERRVKV